MKRTIKLTIEIEADEEEIETTYSGKDYKEQIEQDFIDNSPIGSCKVTLEEEYDE